jgi:hypothetical protein
MPAPDDIVNGTTPDATKIQTWFDYLAGLISSGGLRVGTHAELQAIAVAAPTAPFDGWATDSRLRLFYTGDVTQGESGWITLGGSTPTVDTGDIG